LFYHAKKHIELQFFVDGTGVTDLYTRELAAERIKKSGHTVNAIDMASASGSTPSSVIDASDAVSTHVPVSPAPVSTGTDLSLSAQEGVNCEDDFNDFLRAGGDDSDAEAEHSNYVWDITAVSSASDGHSNLQPRVYTEV